jgi:hypothetical protein
MKHNEDWIESQVKSMLKTMLPIWIIGGVIVLAANAGIIWFIFWCLRHFGVL